MHMLQKTENVRFAMLTGFESMRQNDGSHVAQALGGMSVREVTGMVVGENEDRSIVIIRPESHDLVSAQGTHSLKHDVPVVVILANAIPLPLL